MPKILGFLMAGLLLSACGGGDGGGPQSLCQQIGTVTCQKACSCLDGPMCAVGEGGATLSFNTEAACRTWFVTLACLGDMPAYNDAAACLPLIQAATCAGTGADGALSFPPEAACQTPP